MKYIEAHVGRRAAALLINYFCISLLLQLLIWLQIMDAYSHAIIAIGAILLSTYKYQSPGKKIMRLKVLKDDNGLLSFKERLLRNCPAIIYFGSVIVPHLGAGRTKEILYTPWGFVVTTALIGILFFVFCNYLTVFFNKHGKSLIDMRLDSGVKEVVEEYSHKPLKGYWV